MAWNIANVSSERRVRFASNFRFTAALMFGGMPEQAPAGYYTKGSEWCGPNPITGSFRARRRLLQAEESCSTPRDAQHLQSRISAKRL